MIRIIKCLLRLVLVFIAVVEARADDWSGPRTKEVFSESGDYFVRVIPGEGVGDTFGFYGAKKGKYATAQFYCRDKDSYKLTAETVLLNPVAPVEFLVSNDSRLATLDNWYNLGYGKVVVLYDSNGHVVQSYELSDLFLPEEIKNFTLSVSSIHWRQGPTYIRPDHKTLLVTVRSGADLLFGLETGRYKYCEYKGNEYRCRNSNHARRWLPNNKVQLTR
jgi:hypothetical protein